MSPLEVGPIYAPGAGPPHPDVLRREAQLAWLRQPASAPSQAPVASPAPPPPLAPPPPAAPAPAPPQPPPVAQPAPPAQPAAAARAPVAAREHRRRDWVIGVVLGVVLGLAVAAGFVFLGSEDTVDAPRIHGIDTSSPAANGRPAPAPAEPEKLPGQ